MTNKCSGTTTEGYGRDCLTWGRAHSLSLVNLPPSSPLPLAGPEHQMVRLLLGSSRLSRTSQGKLGEVRRSRATQRNATQLEHGARRGLEAWPSKSSNEKGPSPQPHVSHTFLVAAGSRYRTHHQDHHESRAKGPDLRLPASNASSRCAAGSPSWPCDPHWPG